jgi:TonB family protein
MLPAIVCSLCFGQSTSPDLAFLDGLQVVATKGNSIYFNTGDDLSFGRDVKVGSRFAVKKLVVTLRDATRPDRPLEWHFVKVGEVVITERRPAVIVGTYSGEPLSDAKLKADRYVADVAEGTSPPASPNSISRPDGAGTPVVPAGCDVRGLARYGYPTGKPPGSEAQSQGSSVAGQVFNSTDACGVRAPVPVTRVEAEYPESARKSKKEGEVTLWATVDTAGKARDIATTKFTPGPEFDVKAIEALEKWKFKPGLKDLQPVNVRVQVRFTFHLLDRFDR